MKHKYISNSEKYTEKVAHEFAHHLNPGDVVSLVGDLGTGKSTFVRAAAHKLGVKTRILSPTFSLVRSHKVGGHKKIKTLYHVDLYRAEESDHTIQEILKEFQQDDSGVMFIEWPKNNFITKNTWTISIDGKNSRVIKIFKEDDYIKKDEVAIFPTDTAFGIGCRIDDEKGVKKLFKLRKRPHDKAVPVLVADLEMAKEYGTFDTRQQKLANTFWPGGLTIVVKAKKDKVPNLVRGGGDTIGLRMPDHDKLLNIIHSTGVPILGPSANFAGETTPYEKEDLSKELKVLADKIIPGKTKSKIASTVIDTTTSPWMILRKGAVSTKDLSEFLKS